MIENVGEAVGVLVQAAEIATKQGVFSLSETRFVVEAIEFLMPDYFKSAEQKSAEENTIEVDVPLESEETLETQPGTKEYNF